MSKTYVSVALRRLVRTRAKSLCEYCLIREEDTYFGCQVDHIISEKHGGATHESNLAYACSYCNRNKGSDIGSIVAETQQFCRFFNPRIDQWTDHFKLDGIRITALTSIGKVTAHILGFNHVDRLIERGELAVLGEYPSIAALAVISRISEAR